MIELNKIPIELKSMSKNEKKTPAGIEQTIYSCVLKGVYENIKATLKLESTDIDSLNSLISQRMGINADIELKPWNQNKIESE
jgi:hypothetical protein